MKRVTRGIAALAVSALLLPGVAHAVNFSGPTHFATFAGPNSVDVGNFNLDADSDPDLILGSTGSVNLTRYLGAAGGSFASLAAVGVGGGGPRDAVVGNFTNDSDPDLAVVRRDFDAISIMQGTAPGGGFTGPISSYVVGDAPATAAVGHFNSDVDSLPDIVVPNAGSGTISVLLGAGGGTFSGPTNYVVGTTPVSVAIGSFNPETDSDPDLAVANQQSNDVSILLGGVGGAFGAPTTIASNFPRSVAAGDFNGDGDGDLAIGQDNSVCSCNVLAIQLGGAGASFSLSSEHQLGTGPYHDMVIADFDLDTIQDIAVPKLGSAHTNNVSVMVGGGDGTFTGPTNFAAASGATAVGSGDFDGDSKPDLAVANNLANSVSILLNTSTPPPPPAAPTLTTTSPASPANDDSPEVIGSAAAGTTVNLYAAPTTSDCTPSNLLATGTATALAAPGITVSVGADSTTVIRGTATNANGTSACSSSSVTYVEDSTAPNTTIDSGPTGPTGDPTFTFSSNEPGGTFECKVDLGGFASCVSPKTYRLPIGNHTFDVRAIDKAGNVDPSPDTRSFYVDAYARPKSATPLSIRLVTAYEPCGSPNAGHGTPLDLGSCNPPVRTSDYLTVGTADSNGLNSNSIGLITLGVVGESPVNPNNGDQADVNITVSVTDVFRNDLTEYTGELEGVLTLRMTDRINGTGEDVPGTTMDAPIRFPINCAATPAAAGATCSVATSADGVMAGVVREGKRSLWGLGEVEIFDGGSDELASTSGDNTLFVVQGLFTP